MMVYCDLCFCRYIKSSDKVYSTADEFYVKGDEEKAYVLYMKYFNIIALVKKSPDYKKQHVHLEFYFFTLPFSQAKRICHIYANF